MPDIQKYTEILKSLGYSDGIIKQLITQYLIDGDADALEYHMSNNGIKNNGVENKQNATLRNYENILNS